MKFHLVVLVHGVWGNSSHMSYLADQIQHKTQSSDPNEKIVVYKTVNHSGYLTYDGIDVNGKRITDEILAEVARLGTDKVVKFSIVGYSMGGLVCRYAVGILHHHKFFETVKPIHFVTFCTPHVGLLNPSNTLSSRIFNFVAPYVLVHTGQQMWLQDRTAVNHNVPLLVYMADPTSVFYQALLEFETRSLYANTINDRRTSWYTTSISDVDPFHSMVNESLSAYHMEYIPGYEPNVIDFTRPISFKKIEREIQSFSFKRIAFKSFIWLKVICNLVLITPVYSIYLLGNAIYQRVMLNQRLRHFYKESADSLTVLYDLVQEDVDSGSNEVVQTLEEDLHEKDEGETYMRAFEDKIRDQTDDFVESIFSAVNSASYYDYHYSITKAPSAQGSVEDLLEESRLLNKSDLVNLKGKAVTGDFKLNINENQEFIVSRLNNLKWNKYPVIIRNTKATHAAVIYRQADPTFDEGKVVVRHFIEQVFRV